MAIDNLNFYSAWLPAGQQTDRYSSQPWCLRSKNLDIFSSSKSVKATAWTTPTQTDSDVIKEEWGLVLKTDWKVYDSEWTLIVDPSINFPVNPVSYTWENWPYANAQRWTPQDLSVIAEWDEWKSFVVYTDRSSYLYSKVPYILDKQVHTVRSHWNYDSNLTRWTDNYIWFTEDWQSNSSMTWFHLNIAWDKVSNKVKVRIKYNMWNNISFSVTTGSTSEKFYYDAELDSMISKDDTTGLNSLIEIEWTPENWMIITLPVISKTVDWYFEMKDTTSTPLTGKTFWVDFNYPASISPADELKNGDFNESYWYLPIRERKLVDIWVYWYSQTYWMKWNTYQYLYKWVSSWVKIDWQKQVQYDFITDMGRPTDPWMDVVWLTIWNEQVYMVGNLNWDWYIIPCDLTWWVGNPYVAYWCTFKGVTNIDYLMYLVWDDRGISQLWVFNNQELVPLVWGNQEKDKKNLIKNEEQYRFDWKIVEYRWNLILSTEDNRIFEYGQTYGGKWGTFIHEIDGEIKELKAKGNDLIVKYTKNNIDYTITYQDDTPIKNYNTEWMAEYPIVIWNHLLEKEESDLFASYILPSSNCKLEFWGMANHYHFRTFTSEDNYTFDSELSYKLKWATWDYELKFIEKNGNQYTFRLEWDLPIQTTNDMKITSTGWVELINYSEYNHFRKIWTIETDKYCEWEFRFHNLNNKLELPKSHSLQIMVKGKGNQNYTPELFALDLVANQRERW